MKRVRKTREPQRRVRKTRQPKRRVTHAQGYLAYLPQRGLIWKCYASKAGSVRGDMTIGESVGRTADEAADLFYKVWGRFGFERPFKVKPKINPCTKKQYQR